MIFIINICHDSSVKIVKLQKNKGLEVKFIIEKI
mgnify:CR=1 FL=1